MSEYIAVASDMSPAIALPLLLLLLCSHDCFRIFFLPRLIWLFTPSGRCSIPVRQRQHARVQRQQEKNPTQGAAIAWNACKYNTKRGSRIHPRCCSVRFLRNMCASCRVPAPTVLPSTNPPVSLCRAREAVLSCCRSIRCVESSVKRSPFPRYSIF